MPAENSVGEEISTQTARAEFKKIIDEYRHSALWFFNDERDITLEHPVAGRVLDAIAQKAPRSTWITVRKLKKWRLRNLK